MAGPSQTNLINLLIHPSKRIDKQGQPNHIHILNVNGNQTRQYTSLILYSNE